VIDHFEQVTDKDAAIMTRRIPREEGIFVGNSAGAAMAGLIQVKDQFKEGDVVVVIFHDHGTRYLGKMFNEEWMQDRGFLPKEPTKTALDLIQNHKELPMVSISANSNCQEAFDKMQKYKISQIPVIADDGTFVGSIEESHLYRRILQEGCSLDTPVSQIMGDPYPVVGFAETIENISKQINEHNTACLVMDMAGNWHIITKQDIIQAISAEA
jgi:cystathionine beta-synthase